MLLFMNASHTRMVWIIVIIINGYYLRYGIICILKCIEFNYLIIIMKKKKYE